MLPLASRVLIPTSKEINTKLSRSHDLMLRSNLIRQSSSGIYALLPLGVRVQTKLKTIIKQELDEIGSHEVELPILQSKSLWDISGRWEKYGAELCKLQDRKKHNYCLGPTHEEEVTNLATSLISSFSQLPLMIYQFGKKFRDELRPRAGLLRAREFLMKDLYTFDHTHEDGLKTYYKVQSAYHKIFQRIGLPYVVAEADAGSIGGSLTHEFHFLSSAGEDTVLNCGSCGYTANKEQALSKPVNSCHNPNSSLEFNQVQLLNLILELVNSRNFSALKITNVPNCFIYSNIDHPDKFLIVILSENQELNSVKFINIFNNKLVLASFEKLLTVSDPHIDIVLDKNFESTESNPSSIEWLKEKVLNNHTSNNSINGNLHTVVKQLINSPGKISFEDLRLSQPGDLCYQCNSTNKLVSHNAIEVGHTFLLGTKYSQQFGLSCKVQNKQELINMGCYGIGVSRILAAIVENTHDDKGLRWPKSIAPYQIAILPLFPIKGSNAELFSNTLTLIQEKISQIDSTLLNDILVDDRNVSPGQRLNEIDFLGIPISIRLGRKFISDSLVEVYSRWDNQIEIVSLENLSECLQKFLNKN